MRKGLLHEKTFHLTSPQVESELETFRAELKERMQKYGVKQLVFLEKKLADTVHVVVIPVSGGAPDPRTLRTLLTEGFGTGPTVSDVSQYSQSTINPVGIQFGNDHV